MPITPASPSAVTKSWARFMPADAILAMRFDTSEMGGQWTEICAYGTAVTVRKV